MTFLYLTHSFMLTAYDFYCKLLIKLISRIISIEEGWK